MAIRIKPVFSSTGTANRVAVFDPNTGLLTASIVTVDELELLSGISGGDILTEDNVKTVSGKTFNQDLVADATNEHDIGSSAVRWKDLYLAGDVDANDGAFSGNVTIQGNLYVQGTGTEVITQELQVEDPTITVNKGGDDTTSEGAGLVVERSTTDAQLIHADASATKFRAGPAGSEVDLVGTSSTQTLTGKTIVAASNTITTAASGNLTSTELNAALAELQTDVDTRATTTQLNDHINDASDAHDASAISVSPTGNLSATDAQAAFAELQGDADALDSRLDTAEGEIDQLQIDVVAAQQAADDAQTAIDNHIGDSSAAHAASAVAVTPAGNLAADDVQEALEELQADVDTRATSSALTAHINDTTDAHAASAIGSTPSGNLAATDVQGALVELQSDIDTRALASDLSTHESDTSTHGVSGDIVGTSDAQTITNKDIDGGTASDTSRFTLPKNTKSNLDGLTRKEATVVYGTDTKKAYVDDGTNLIPIGSGSGSGSGINLITLDSSFTAGANPNNFDFEDAIEGLGTWTVYADAAATAPVDMTGGSPGTTIARITSGELNGSASAQVDLGSGSSRQGEGWMTPVHIPPAYRGRTLTCLMPYAISGSVVEDDLVPYVYDVTNSQLIKPYVKDKLLGSAGIGHFTFPVSTNTAEIRVGVHIARTATTTLAITFDDVQVSPFSTPIGLSGSDWKEVSADFSVTGCTPTDKQIYLRYVGDIVEVSGSFTATSLTSSGSSIDLPNYIPIDFSKISNTAFGMQVGIAAAGQGNSTNNIFSGDYARIAFVDGDSGSSPVTNKVYLAYRVGTGGYEAGIGTAVFINNGSFTFSFSFPVSGKSANVSMAESSTFLISSYLANGTRVTATPTKLGEYRSRYKNNSSSNNFVDVAPTTTPSSTNGMKLDAIDYSTGQTSGLISLYDIFVGKNKTVRPAIYASTGRTGTVLWDYTQSSSTAAQGVRHHYDSTTGVLTIEAGVSEQATTTRFIGRDLAGNGVSSGYFDIQVSENALAVGVQAPRSYISVYNGNGHGSTNNKIRRFTTTLETSGSAIAYADSATLGASFTINESGIYSIHYGDYGSGGCVVGISRNASGSDLTTAIGVLSVPAAFLSGVNVSANNPMQTSWTGYLAAGDVVRPHTDGNPNVGSDLRVKMTICKVSH